MDIKHLEYFLSIVENNYNLSRAAEALYLSQPALTKYIKDFEQAEGKELFVRHRGRLVDLTSAGKTFHKNAVSVTKAYRKLMLDLREHDDSVHGTIRIGIPPVVISILFRSALPAFIMAHSNIRVEITEAGAAELTKKLLLREIDIAILLEPLSHPSIGHTRIVKDRVVAVCRSEHRLAGLDRPVTYDDLAQEKLIILNASFTLHHQILKNFRIHSATPNIFFQSAQWDLLLSICKKLDTVSLLPAPILNHCNKENLSVLPIEPAFPWIVSLATLKKIYKSELIEYTEAFFTEFFAKNTNDL